MAITQNQVSADIPYKTNYAINGDMRISQRGDFSIISSMTSGEFWVDGWSQYLTTISGNKQHLTTNQPVVLTGSKSLKHIATSNGSGAIGSRLDIEDKDIFSGKQVTASVWVKSNHTSARIMLYTTTGTASISSSETHSGNEEWELLKVTATMQENPAYLALFGVIIGEDAASVSISNGDYIEFTGAKIEFGTLATPFLPAPLAQEQISVGIPNDTDTTLGRSRIEVASGKNLLLNSEFTIHQRKGATAITGSYNTYGPDRWMLWGGQSQCYYVPTGDAPSQVQNAYIMGRSDGATNTGTHYMGQSVENNMMWHVRGKPVTFSFWAKSYTGTTGTFTAQLMSHTGYVGASSMLTSLVSKVIPLTTSWKQYVLHATVPSNAQCVGPKFVRSGYTGTASGDYVFIGGVMVLDQVESSPVFRPYSGFANEVIACKRYFEKSYALHTAIGTPAQWAGINTFWSWNSIPNNQYIGHLTYTVEKRNACQLTFYGFSGATGYWSIFDNGVDTYRVDGALSGQTCSKMRNVSGVALPVDGRYSFHWAADAEV